MKVVLVVEMEIEPESAKEKLGRYVKKDLEGIGYTVENIGVLDQTGVQLYLK